MLGPQLILASASPRRRKLLDQIGVTYEVCAVAVDETVQPGESPPEHVMRLAQAKAQAARAVTQTGLPVLGADTVVAIEGRILGKPQDEAEALAYLRELSGRCHYVLSAVCLDLADPPRILKGLSASRVHFRELTQDEIMAYCHTGEPIDKAGAYAIQGRGAIFVKRLEGSFSGVVGLPLYETASLLRKAGIQVL